MAAVLLRGAELVAVPLLRDAEVETGFILEGVPTALGRFCFVLGDSVAVSLALSAAEGDPWAADTMVPSGLVFSVLEAAAGADCCVSGF